ncbi:MAG: leucine-rich repeat domain-containing protein [Alphaproteobacteria bacterium]|nr:leucine-rich repeat domain-containing protein [Alphaproteobacteria bacterium]
MKRLIFFMCFALQLCGTVSVSLADDSAPTSGTCNSSGTCLWNLSEDGTLTISAKPGAEDVKTDNYRCDDASVSICRENGTLIERPWEANLEQIKKVVIGDNISYIGDDAFQLASNLKSVTGMKDLQSIGNYGVFAYTGLTEFTMPENISTVGSRAFAFTPSLKNLIIPDQIETISADFFFIFSSGANITCLGNIASCNAKLAKFFKETDCPEGFTCNCTSNCIKTSQVKPASETQCIGVNYYWNGVSCDNKKDGINCADGYYATNYDLCKKIKLRYTLPEADAATSDDNENTIEWIFE